MLENDLVRATVRADNAEDKIIDLEAELKIVGDSMKAMEVIYSIILLRYHYYYYYC